MKKLSGKIQRYKGARGVDGLSFRIVWNYWDKTRPTANREGTASSKLIDTIITLPENKLNDPLYQVLGWEKIEKTLHRLKRENKLSDGNAETIRAKFARRLPRPAAPVPIAKLKPLDAAKERLNAKFGLGIGND